MEREVRSAFEREIIILPVDEILPRRQVTAAQRSGVKFRRIAASVKEVGIIEPLMVARLPNVSDRHVLLDGHMRWAILQELGTREVRCLIAHDDEAFTYNKRINRLATIQEHYMILRAIKNGVSEEKLAKALDLNIGQIQRRRTLLDGICPEVIELLRDRSVNPATFDSLRRMKPMRQIEVVELMEIAGNWTATYARSLLAATRQEDLAKSERPKKVAGLTAEQMARMEREMASLHQDFKQIESSYGDDILHLVIVSGFLAKLIGNPEIERYLVQHHRELLEGFRSIVAATNLDQAGAAA
ncbi:ParB N-terminal domain-containing protein [Ancylobacter sp. 6x-1]|uniref:ParB N-terminal domain-containing protein n=1 Tax=Ancylobacter crimeensis TaxID=2579147 RepID=A0ABT0DBL8_9HYPH|nr:plasmid partitioning protein RepB C-terminal domain-containing protein [Ancylobacter crimeensis]MCK0197356.1 ParB N-terminal domain-containing protein [Ancylobacter crimeensis]